MATPDQSNHAASSLAGKSPAVRPPARPLFSQLTLLIGSALSAGLCVLALQWLGYDDAAGELTSSAIISFGLLLAVGQFARWRFRISIRTILILTAVVGILCAFVGREIFAVRKEQQALDVILRNGGNVVYRQGGEVRGKWFVTTAGIPIPLWIKDHLLGEEFFSNIYELRCEDQNEHAPFIPQLARLRKVERLDVAFSNLTAKDLAHMPVIPGLQTLTMKSDQLSEQAATNLARQPELHLVQVMAKYRSPVDGVDQLVQIRELTVGLGAITNAGCRELALLPRLKILRLDANFCFGGYYSAGFNDFYVQDAELLSGSRSIEVLELHYAHVSPGALQPLQHMPQLSRLTLLGSSFDDQDLAVFRAARPDVEVVR